MYPKYSVTLALCFQFKTRGVVPGGAGGAMTHPVFGRSVDPISTRGDILCPPNYYLQISDLPTALKARDEVSFL
jgi:hypothetical protein